jgi:hypothetical protein
VIDHNGLIVEHTETSSAVYDSIGMVPGGPEQSKCPVNQAVYYKISCNNGTPCSNAMGFGNPLIKTRYHNMRPKNLLIRGQARTVFMDRRMIEKPFFLNLISGVQESFLTFGVIGTDRPIEGREKNQSYLCHLMSPLTLRTSGRSCVRTMWV